jgi:ribosome recycling factor
MSDEYIAEMNDDYAKVESGFKQGLAAIRTGRASPQILENVQVQVASYGASMTMKELASISVGDARLLVVNPWDKGTIADIERGIQAAGLGLNPSNDGVLIRVPIPALTGERRQALVKQVRKLLEDARVRARHVRKEYNDIFKDLQSDKEITEDDLKRLQGKVQEGIDGCNKDLQEIASEKEKEVMEA